MDLLSVLLDFINFEDRTISELLEISSLIDSEKNSNGVLVGRKDDIAVIASLIVALVNEKSTVETGEQLLNNLNAAIVKKNLKSVELNNGKELYEKLQVKELPGTFKIKTTPSGYRFNFVASNGEVLSVSELYSTLESCLNGIKSVQANLEAEIENQTETDYTSIRYPKYEVYVDKFGEYRFRLKARNGAIIVVSSGFREMSACINTINKMKEAMPSSDVAKE